MYSLIGIRDRRAICEISLKRTFSVGRFYVGRFKSVRAVFVSGEKKNKVGFSILLLNK